MLQTACRVTVAFPRVARRLPGPGWCGCSSRALGRLPELLAEAAEGAYSGDLVGVVRQP